MDEVRQGQRVNICRVCGSGFEGYDLEPVLKDVECSNCGAEAQIFSGVVLQDNGENMFDIYGHISDCAICEKEPDIEFVTRGTEHYF